MKLFKRIKEYFRRKKQLEKNLILKVRLWEDEK